MKRKLFWLLPILLMVISCTKKPMEDDMEIMPDPVDPCENIVCNNGGTCVNGECECPVQYTGPACNMEKVPTKMRMGGVSITEYPVIDQSGVSWDPFDGPDLYFRIWLGDDILYTSSTKYNYSEQLVTWAFNFEFSDPTATYNLSLYEDDDFSSDDFIGGINFTPYKPGTGFPYVIEISCGACVISFDLIAVTYSHF